MIERCCRWWSVSCRSNLYDRIEHKYFTFSYWLIANHHCLLFIDNKQFIIDFLHFLSISWSTCINKILPSLFVKTLRGISSFYFVCWLTDWLTVFPVTNTAATPAEPHHSPLTRPGRLWSKYFYLWPGPSGRHGPVSSDQTNKENEKYFVVSVCSP